jgi:dienelactone hydrolase
VARIVLFHHAQGLRPDVEDWAESLRSGGHEVSTPDLFEGAAFDNLEDGVANRDQIGIRELIRRAASALSELPPDLVYSGFSMGAQAAQYFAATRPEARAAILMHGGMPGEPIEWPGGTLAQLHYMTGDPWVDAELVPPFAAAVEAAGSKLEVFSYPGEGHLFADPAGADYDPAAAGAMLERELDLLERLG